MKEKCIIILLLLFTAGIFAEGLIYHDFDFGYTRTADELGFTDDEEHLHIVDVAYNHHTDELLLLEARDVTDDEPDPEDTASIAIVDRETGDFKEFLAENITLDYPETSLDPRRITVTEDGVVLILGTIGCVYKVSEDGDYTMLFSGHAYDPEDLGWGGARAFNTVGSYYGGDLTILSSRGNRVYFWQNSPEDVDDFGEYVEYFYCQIEDGDSTPHPFIHGILPSEDLSEIYVYQPRVWGTEYDDHASHRLFTGSIEEGYNHEADIGGFHYEDGMCGDIDGDFIVVTRGHSEDETVNTRILFTSISEQAPVFEGNEGTGFFLIEDTITDNREGGVTVDTVHGQVFAVNSYGLFQLIGDVEEEDIPTAVGPWHLFE